MPWRMMRRESPVALETAEMPRGKKKAAYHKPYDEEYKKARPTFVDALAQVRRALWRQLGFCYVRFLLSEAAIEKQKSAPAPFDHVAELLAYVA
jgi:hypothetical protein